MKIKYSELTQPMINMIFCLYHESKVRVSDIADEFGISPKHLYQIVKEGTNKDKRKYRPMSDELKKKISEGMKRYHRVGLRNVKGNVRHLGGGVWKIKEDLSKYDREGGLPDQVPPSSTRLGDTSPHAIKDIDRIP